MRAKLFILFLFVSTFSFSQRDPQLPVGYSPEEKAMLDWQEFVTPSPVRGMTDPPGEPVRHMAEWEELQALIVTWRTYPNILVQIVRHAKEEVKVIVCCDSPSVVQDAKDELLANNVTLDNIEFVVIPNNSVWVRDYGPNCVYANDVENLYFIDWIYNRITRPKDDVLSDDMGDYLGIPVYSTTEAPYDMVHTGGNFMSDGLGTAFSSKLGLNENAAGNIFGAGPHDEAEIDDIVQAFMGITRYPKMETLPYDEIHHIDMHMKLLDEETLLVGQYPEGVADGPQIEANLQYILNNYNSAFGTPYKVKRIIQPPGSNGAYPNSGGPYRTYTNSVFINKTILIPTYQQQYDTTALRVWRENFPGYKVVGINCNQMITALGALHCITKEVGVSDPLWIVHQPLDDIEDNEVQGDYQVDARLKHISGISQASVYYTTDTTTQAYQSLPMTMTNASSDTWTGYIPHQPDGSEVFYYVFGEAVSGKTQVRPIPAPAGYWHFTVNGVSTAVKEPLSVELKSIYPNPASAITVIPVQSSQATEATIQVSDVLGKTVETVFQGHLPGGESNYFIHAESYQPGTYFVSLKTGEGVRTQRLVVK